MLHTESLEGGWFVFCGSELHVADLCFFCNYIYNLAHYACKMCVVNHNLMTQSTGSVVGALSRKRH